MSHILSHIAGVVGPQYLPTDAGYSDHQQQYASSTYQGERQLDPGLIVLAANVEDIKLTLRTAKKLGVAVALRTGGHQYSGASSTGPQNIQLDLSNAFKGLDDLMIKFDGDKTVVRASVSYSLGDFINFLSEHKVFVPTGQCTDVHLGGHVQTGGYGQLIRSFGLLGDHVISIEYIDADENVLEASRSVRPDMFSAFLGGSPGNLGVLTHFTVEVHRDSDYDGSCGLLAVHLYSKGKLNELLDQLVKMSDDKDFPGNYDLCISVLSRSWKLGDFHKGLEDALKILHPEHFDPLTGLLIVSAIIVYAQWVKFGPNETPDNNWFDQLKKGSLISTGVLTLPMSDLVKLWLFRAKREYDHPYIKRTLSTNSSTLAQDRWADWMSTHIDKICNQDNGLFVSSQLQCIGGNNSKFTTNAGNNTSYSWRDSSLGCTVDCFHEADKLAQATAWEEETDTMIGPKGPFATQQRRVLWGSYGDWHMENVWQHYYDSPEVYQKIQQARKAADPYKVFTPNPFCVPIASSPLELGQNAPKKDLSAHIKNLFHKE